MKNKIVELESGSKTPTSIKTLETELKKTEKEVRSLEESYNQVIANIDSKQLDIDFNKGLGNSDKVNQLSKELTDLDAQSISLADKLENARDKTQQLKWSLENAKLNPRNISEVQQLSSQLEMMNSKLSQTKDEANQTKDAINKALNQKANYLENSLGNITDKLNDVNKGVQKFGKKITNLLLTTFVFNLIKNGLTSVRNSLLSLLKTDSSFNSSLNQIKANLMTAFAPIYNACLPAINSLMNSLSKITGTIAVFVSSLFGTSLKDATKQAKGLSKALDKTAQSGDKANGSLASFDNLEVIQDNSSASSSGGLGADGINYSDEIEYSTRLLEWLNNIKNFIVENKDMILGFLAGLATAILLIKAGLGGIKSLGIGVMVAGIVYAIGELLKYIQDPSWENFGGIITGIGIAILGLGIATGNVYLIIAGIFLALVGLLAKNWDKAKELFQNGIDWITNHFEDLVKKFGPFGFSIAQGVRSVLTIIMTLFDDMFKGCKNVLDGIIKICKGDFKGGIKQVFSGLGQIFLAPFHALLNGGIQILNGLIQGLNMLIKGANKIKFDVPDWVPGIGGKEFGFNIPTISTIPLPHLAEGTVIPPRHKFAAILGDQKHGTNIEAPLETIKQANREVLTEFLDKIGNLGTKVQEIILKNLTFVIQLGVKDFKKVVIEAVRLSEKELGKTLFVS